jgi:hypothetical protein
MYLRTWLSENICEVRALRTYVWRSSWACLKRDVAPVPPPASLAFNNRSLLNFYEISFALLLGLFCACAAPMSLCSQSWVRVECPVVSAWWVWRCACVALGCLDNGSNTDCPYTDCRSLKYCARAVLVAVSVGVAHVWRFFLCGAVPVQIQCQPSRSLLPL